MHIIFFLIIMIIALAAVIMAQKSDFRVTRSTAINAPSPAVFAEVNDFHRWEAWSPWAKIDPACKNIFEGSTSGTGAVFKWEGNRKVGAGMMTIEESRPSEYIRIRLQFFKPMKAINTTEFTFKEEAGQTIVTWSMFGKNNFMGKFISLFMNCDKMVGNQFSQGLASIKAIAESKK